MTGLVPFPQRNRFPTRYRGGGSRSPPRCEDTWGGTPGGGHPPRPTFPRCGVPMTENSVGPARSPNSRALLRTLGTGGILAGGVREGVQV